jgi:3-phenylpropionate/trans-cinnamate dioxygenase ferredoxin component
MKLVARVKLDEVKASGMVRVPHPPFDVLVAWVDGEVFAIEDACNHAGASLAEGWLEDKCVVCPMHGYVFDLADGALLRPKGLCSDQRRYIAKVEGEEVAVYDDFSLTIL